MISDFTPPRSDGRRGWRLKLPHLTGSDSLPTLSLPGLGPGELSVLHQTSCFYLNWAGAVVIGITAFEILLGKAKWSNARQCVARNGSAR